MIWRDYLIVYKITEEAIIVISLFHTKQNPKKILNIDPKTKKAISPNSEKGLLK